MKALFLSDTHLRRRSDKNYRLFIAFMSQMMEGAIPGHPKGEVERLYLVGDIFDFWFARKDKIYPEYLPVLEKFQTLLRRGIEIHFFEGNHDFFLREYFSGMRGHNVYEDWGDILLDGFRLCVSHGDLIDRQNRRYLFLRRILRSRGFFLFQRHLPLPLVWFLAGLSSDLGQEKRKHGEETLVRTMYEFALKQFELGYDASIFGHCHLPRLYTSRQGGRNRVFVVLGDWLRHFTFLYYQDGTFYLRDISGQNIGSGHLG